MEHAASRYTGRRIRGVLLYGACDAQVVARFPLRTYEVAVTSVDWNGASSEVCARISEIAELLRSDDALGVPMGEVLRKAQGLPDQGGSSALG
jgi:hypothetical protein